MAKNIFVGVNNVAKKPSNIYIGVDGKARRVKEVFIGVNGIARKCWPSSVLPNRYTQFEYIDGRCGRIYIDIDPLSYPRIVIEFSVFANSGSSSLIYGRYDYDYYSPDTGQGWQDTWLLGYVASHSANQPFYFSFSAYQMLPSGSFPDESQYSTYFNSNSSEGVLINTRYKLDYFNNGSGVYLYNSEGYYSIASHNSVGSISSKPSITNKYGSPYIDYGNSIMLFGGDSDIIYGAKVYKGSTLLRNYYPCYRNSDHAMGYFDLVNQVFYNCKRGYIGRESTCTYEEAVGAGYKIGPIV